MKLKTYTKFRMKNWWRLLPTHTMLISIFFIARNGENVLLSLTFFVVGISHLIYMGVKETEYIKKYGTKKEIAEFN